MTRDECRRKYDENILLYTYPAVAGYLSEGECDDGKRN